MADGRFPYLLSLPPELLTPIFLEAKITIRNLVICRDLLPYTLISLYETVDLCRKSQILAFHQAVQNPDLARLVKSIGVSRNKDSVPVYIRSALRRHQSSQWRDVLIDILRRLVSLEGFYTFSEGLAAYAFSDFYQPGVAEHLSSVGVHLTDGDQFTEDEKSLFVSASRLPALEEIILEGGPCRQLPFDLAPFANTSPSTRPLPAHSWRLISLTLNNFDTLGEECRYIFESFTALRELAIRVRQLSPAFAKHLALLPKTLEFLELDVFDSPRLSSHPAAQASPKLNTIGALFPNLQRLYLNADVYTPPFFGHLHYAQELEVLRLGHNSPFTIGDLIPLLQPGLSTKLPSLKTLDLHVCGLGKMKGGRIVPWSMKWPEEYSKKGGKKLVGLCAEQNIELKGAVKCALGICSCQGGYHYETPC
ncbi:hypothetical protein BCR35DRAFT_324732 [Leucosporidium creatinivorum]|uniref:F-box domain-containing protein n=1 Tax=Leucosporidium creatinivorum TaxID=106004 RepID=A0A1Y2FL00_9BASI|nr:hypothetical protein BCR35DRAFT_324732 [Leucosporidium creatinivorum]